MWIKKFDNTNVAIETIQELHTKLKDTYGNNFVEIFDYIPPESPTSNPDPYLELRFEEEPDDLGPALDLVEEYKVSV